MGVSAVSELPYLDAVINETLRLHPPVPSGLQRITPPEGLFIGETFVPGNTVVQAPSHTMFRGASLHSPFFFPFAPLAVLGSHTNRFPIL